MRHPRTSGRLARRLGLERNPLRRASDHLEARARVAAVLLCVVAVPVSVSAGALTREHLDTAAAHQSATRVRHLGTVVDDPHLSAARSVVVTTARVAWTGTSGEPVETTVLVPAAAERGDRIPVWTTRDGVRTSAPLSSGRILALTGLAGTGVLLGLIALSLALLRGLRWALDQGRYRAWESEWAQLDSARR